MTLKLRKSTVVIVANEYFLPLDQLLYIQTYLRVSGNHQ